MLETMCSELKTNHYEILAGHELDEEAALEQVVFDKHQRKAKEFIDCLVDLLEKSQLSDSSPGSTNNLLVDIHMDLLGNFIQTIRRAIETPDFMDTHMLMSYLDEVSSLKGDMGEYLQKASDIKGTLFDLHVGISCIMEWMKKEPTQQAFGMPTMDGVNLPQIEIPAFDTNILNWQPFWEQFTAAV